MKKMALHVGSGPARVDKLHLVFRTPQWREMRLDIDPKVFPDIVADITDMPNVGSGDYDAIWCSHCLEHLDEHAVKLALREFRRVLSAQGFVLITCPDLLEVARLITEGREDETVYTSPAGDVRPIDMMFGFQPSVAAGNGFMRHCTGFTARRLGRLLREAGFSEARVRTGGNFDLWAIAFGGQANREGIMDTLVATGLDFRG